MTSRLRMKHQTTARASVFRAGIATSFLVVALGATANDTRAQENLPPTSEQAVPTRVDIDAAIRSANNVAVNEPFVSNVVQTQLRKRQKYADEPSIQVSTRLPGPEVLFRRESERGVFERIRQYEKQRGSQARVIFPKEPPLTKTAYRRKQYPPATLLVEPSYNCHGLIPFEQRNFERFAWDFGWMQPGVSLTRFYFDFITLPYFYGKHAFDQTDCSAGKCLPGDPTPLYLYPPELSLSGFATQAAAVGGLFAFFP